MTAAIQDTIHTYLPTYIYLEDALRRVRAKLNADTRGVAVTFF